MSKKVIVAGHICLDITPVFEGGKRKNISDVLLPGKLVQTEGASVSTGGAVANTGLAMKLLGADVSLMGKIGTDDFGNMICGILDRYDAADGMIRAAGENTSYSVVLAIPGIDRVFLHCPGANNTYTASDVSEAALSGAALFHFGYPPLMKSMYVNGGGELVNLFKKVHDAGCATSLDMAAIDPDSESGRVDWRSILEQLMPQVDFFVPSVEELYYMLDRERFEQLRVRAGGSDITEILDLEEDIKPLADICMDMGCKVLMLKCGAPGLYLRTASEEMLNKIPARLELDSCKWANIEQFERSYKPDKVLSGTGAGDTSIAAFLTSILNKEEPDKCMQLATATGAMCVSAYDALSGLITLDELKMRIDEGWEKLGE